MKTKFALRNIEVAQGDVKIKLGAVEVEGEYTLGEIKGLVEVGATIIDNLPDLMFSTYLKVRKYDKMEEMLDRLEADLEEEEVEEREEMPTMNPIMAAIIHAANAKAQEEAKERAEDPIGAILQSILKGNR